MNIVNFLWHFSTGGIGKCFLTYDKIGDANPILKVKSVCVINDSAPCDVQPLIEQGIEIIHIKGSYDFSWMKRMNEIVKKEKPDAFFCHSHNGPIMLKLFSIIYWFNIPFVCTCHGFNPKPTFASHFWSWIVMRIWKSNWTKKVICVEQFTPPILIKNGLKKNKIVTVYNGIEPNIEYGSLNDSQFFELSGNDIHEDIPIIITASRLTRIKGIDYLIDALATLKVRGVKFLYFCIGNGEEEEALKAQAKDRGLTDNDIRFMGYQSNVPEWLAACDVFALPSLEEFHSIAILEAMRAKKAIVATNIGGNPESLRNEQDALLVPSKDSKALADALERVLTEPKLREKLAASAHERFMERFTIDVMKNNLAREILTAL